MSYIRLAGKSTAQKAINSTGLTIPKFMPVKMTASGMALLSPSLEADVDAFAGVTRTTIMDGSEGDVVVSGLVEDTGLSFSVGATIFISKTGGVTDSKPSIGVDGFVAGDWIIRLGIVIANANPALRDVILSPQIVGQL